MILLTQSCFQDRPCETPSWHRDHQPNLRTLAFNQNDKVSEKVTRAVKMVQICLRFPHTYTHTHTWTFWSSFALYCTRLVVVLRTRLPPKLPLPNLPISAYHPASKTPHFHRLLRCRQAQNIGFNLSGASSRTFTRLATEGHARAMLRQYPTMPLYHRS